MFRAEIISAFSRATFPGRTFSRSFAGLTARKLR
jgi:hypothetical protein